MLHHDRTLGSAIRGRRIELGLTQEELAERIGDGVRQSDVSRLERNQVQLPRPQRLKAIAKALAMEPGELLAASGWDGITADRDADADENETHALPWLPPQAVTAGMPEPAHLTDETHERLHQALERSRQIRAESVEALSRAQEAARTWRQYYGTDHDPEPGSDTAAGPNDA